MNCYSVKYLYKRPPDTGWYSLFIQGILVILIGFLFNVAYTILIVYFVGFSWPPFYWNFGLLFTIFYLLMIPSIGYVSKEMTLVLFTRTKDSQKSSIVEE